MLPDETNTLEVTPPEFVSHYLRACMAAGGSDGTGSVRLIMARDPAAGSIALLCDPTNPVHAHFPDLTPTAERETRELVLDAEEARAEFLDLTARLFPEKTMAALDQFATAILADIVAGRADAADAHWLISWIRDRMEIPRLDWDEAERLFGSVPKFDLSGAGPIISWQELGDRVGPNADFERNQRIAEGIAEEELNDVLETFAGRISAAFLDIWLKHVNGRAH